VRLPYARSWLSLSPPPEVDWRIIKPDEPQRTSSESKVIRVLCESLVTEIGERFERGRRLLIVIPDHTRRCRLPLLLPPVLDELERAGLEIELLMANGSHARQSRDTVRDVVGDQVLKRYPVAQHDCQNMDELAYFGQTSMGTPVWLNRRVADCDFVLTLGAVLHHYFAGYGGGPKMLMPGVAGEQTIRINHCRTIDPSCGRLIPQCREGGLEDNPVYLDLSEIENMVPDVLSLQVVLLPNGRIGYGECGTLLRTHRRMARRVSELYSLPMTAKADVAVASAGGFPTDVNLIQSHKSIHHAHAAVRVGGVVIVAAACTEGIGSETLLPYFEETSSAGIAARLIREYQLNGHTALALRGKSESARIILISKLAPDVVRKMGMEPAAGLREAWKLARVHLNSGSRGVILPAAHLTVPC